MFSDRIGEDFVSASPKEFLKIKREDGNLVDLAYGK
jgi:hypothetical protein